jgi:hypothetical protein
MKLAMFQDIGPYPCTQYYPPEREKYTDMVRMAEYAEIEFVPRKPEEIVPAQVAVIDEKIAEITAEFGRRLAALKEAKGNLLALTQQPEIVE